jgi:CsbD-like.
VSAADKAKDKAQAAKGKVKKGAGKALDDPYMEGEGKADQVKGNLKLAGEKVKTPSRSDLVHQARGRR